MIPISILIAAATPALATDPLEPARSGAVQCHEPNDLHKTCSAIASYRPTGDGSYMSSAEIIVSQEGPVILSVDSPVIVKNGAVCGFIRQLDLAAGRVTVNGEMLSVEDGAPYLAELSKTMGRSFNKEICTRYSETSEGVLGKTKINGVYVPAADTPIRWMSPAEGYRVAP